MLATTQRTLPFYKGVGGEKGPAVTARQIFRQQNPNFCRAVEAARSALDAVLRGIPEMETPSRYEDRVNQAIRQQLIGLRDNMDTLLRGEEASFPKLISPADQRRQLMEGVQETEAVLRRTLQIERAVDALCRELTDGVDIEKEVDQRFRDLLGVTGRLHTRIMILRGAPSPSVGTSKI